MKKVTLIITLLLIIFLSSCWWNTNNKIIIKDNKKTEKVYSEEFLNKEMNDYLNLAMTKKDFFETVDCNHYKTNKVQAICNKDKIKVKNFISNNSWALESNSNDELNMNFYNENTQEFIKDLKENPDLLLDNCNNLNDNETIKYCLKLQREYNLKLDEVEK